MLSKFKPWKNFICAKDEAVARAAATKINITFYPPPQYFFIGRRMEDDRVQFGKYGQTHETRQTSCAGRL